MAAETKRDPLDPLSEQNPLKPIKWHQWSPKFFPGKMLKNFEQNWKIDQPLFDDAENSKKQLFWVKHKHQKNQSQRYLIKTYSVKDKGFKNTPNMDKLNHKWKEYVFVKTTQLMEYETFYDNKTQKVIMLMPYYGQSLRQIIDLNGPIKNENKVKFISFNILHKLWLIHNCKYIHGDIKPGNIVKAGDNEYKLIDFEHIRCNKSKAPWRGTLGWQAPEIKPYKKKNKYEYSSDIFSFGLVILWLLCGKQPLEEDEEKRDNLVLVTESLSKESVQSMRRGTGTGTVKNWVIIWYKDVIEKCEHVIKNQLVQMYYDNEISLDLFELLHDGMLTYDPKKRWNCKQIYGCKWFKSLREEDMDND